MDSRRQSKMASLLQQTMATILQKNAVNFIGNSVLVSITKVITSPDLSVAKFYVSVFGNEEPQLTVDILNSTSYEWRKHLGNELRNNLRKVPEIEFFVDDSMKYAQKMNKIFKDLNEDK